MISFRWLLVAALGAAFLTACTTTPPKPVIVLDGVEPPLTGWRAEARAADLQRIQDLPQIWERTIASVPRRDRRLVSREGVLLQPDAARPYAFTPPGSYLCRLVRLGAPAARGSAVQAFPEFFCHIGAGTNGRLSFTKQTGSELPGGWLHMDGQQRMILMGAKQRAPGDNSIAYGEDPDSDLVGVVERIGPFRWRLALPWRGDRSGIDVYELTPVEVERQAPERDLD